MFKDFLWGKKPPKFRQEILELTYTLGGFIYTNLAIFDKALKANWSRRIYQVSEEWAIFPIHYSLDKIFIFGDIYLVKLKNSTKNVFWRDYISAIEDLIVKRQPFNFTEACAMPIWSNSKICCTKHSAWFKILHNRLDFIKENGQIRI